MSQDRLHVLGDLRLRDASGEGKVPPGQLAMLVAYLALTAPQGTPRETLQRLFWPEVDPSRGRHSLSNALYEVRKALGAESVVARGPGVVLDVGTLEVDALDFAEAIEREDWKRAVTVYRGPLLGEASVRVPPELEQWFERRRDAYSRSYGLALRHMAESAAQAREPGEHVKWLRRLAEHQPHNSRAAADLALAISRAGDVAAALALAEEHKERLRFELGIQEDPVVVDAIQEIRGAAPAPVAPPQQIEGSAFRSAAAVSHPEPPEAGADPVEALSRRQPLDSWTRPVVPLWAVAVLAVVGLAVGTLLVRGARDGAPVRALLVDFASEEDDRPLAQAITSALRVDLLRSARLRLVPPERVLAEIRTMTGGTSTDLTADDARELARRLGVPALIEGEVQRVGDAVLIVGSVVDPETQELISGVALREQAETEAEFIGAIDAFSRRLRRELGDAIQDIQAADPLQTVTTASLPALELYAQAERTMLLDGYNAAIPIYEEAVSVDPGFASAHLRLATARLWSDHPSAAGEALEIANTNQDRLSEVERSRLRATYAWVVDGDLQSAIGRLDQLFETEHGTVLDHLTAGYLHSLAAEWDASEHHYGTALATDSTSLLAFRRLLESQWMQGKDAMAAQTLAALQERFAGDPRALVVEAILRSSNGEFDAADQLLRTALASPETDSFRRPTQLEYLAGLELVRGRIESADSLLVGAARGFEDIGRDDRALAAGIARAYGPAIYLNDSERAARILREALDAVPIGSLPPADRPYAELAAVYAAIGDTLGARAAMEDFEEATRASFLRYEREARHRLALAWIDFSGQRFDAASEQLDRAEVVSSCAACALAVRATAGEHAGTPGVAITFYEQFLQTREWARALRPSPIEGLDPYWYPVALRRLAILREEQGDTAEAIAHYRRYLDVWADADSGLQARVLPFEGRLVELETAWRTRGDSPAR